MAAKTWSKLDGVSVADVNTPWNLYLIHEPYGQNNFFRAPRDDSNAS